MIECSIVIPTYFPGKIIEKLLGSLPRVREIYVFDNSNDEELKLLIENKFTNIEYISTGDIGLGKTFNKALNMINSELIFITQPDVQLYKNCIENLILAKKKYKDAAILAPLMFENDKYSIYDHYRFNLDKDKKGMKIVPSGDFCVEAINSTAFMLDKRMILEIGGWDDYFYTYLEDIDLCYRLKEKKYGILKIKESKVNHVGFKSHKPSIHNYIDKKRIFNFHKSSLYYNYKHKSKSFFYYYTIKNVLKFCSKLLANIILFRKKKISQNFIKLKSYYYFFLYDKFGKKNIQMK